MPLLQFRRRTEGGNGVAMPLAECVVDLVDDRFQRAVLPVAKVDAQRIERVAHDARHAKQLDGGHPIGPASGLSKHGLGLRAKRHGAAIAVIAIEKAEQVKAISREQAQPRRSAADIVEVEQHPEYAIAQAMDAGPQAMVHHVADVKTGRLRHAASSRGRTGSSR